MQVGLELGIRRYVDFVEEFRAKCGLSPADFRRARGLIDPVPERKPNQDSGESTPIIPKKIHASVRGSPRLERSKELLATTKMSAKEIAGMVGYSSAPSFHVSFKEMTGMTPLQYRGQVVQEKLEALQNQGLDFNTLSA